MDKTVVSGTSDPGSIPGGATSTIMFYVYVIKSLKNGSYYKKKTFKINLCNLKAY